MQSMRKPILKLTVAIVVGVMIVVGGLLFWINSSPGRNWLQSRINAAIPGDVAIHRCRLSILEPGLVLDKVVIYDPQGTPVAGVDHLSVAMSWWPLLRREILLKEIRIRAPWADLVLDQSSRLNVVSALVGQTPEQTAPPPQKDEAGLPVNIVCRSFQLTDGRLSFKPADGSMEADIHGITLSAAGNLMQKKARLDLELARARYQTRSIHPPPARIAVKARLEGDRLSLPAVKITAGTTLADLTGSVEGLTDTPVVDGVFSINSQLTELKEIFSIDGDYHGKLSAELRLKGALANPKAQLGLSIGKGRVAGQALDAFALSMDMEDRQAAIKQSALKLADGTLTLNAAVDLREAFGSGFLDPPRDLDAIAYSLSLVPDIPDLHPWLEPWMPINGELGGRIHLTGTGVSPQKMSAQLTMQTRAHHLRAPGLDRPVDAEVNLSAQMEQGRLSIDRLDAATDGLQLTATGSLGMTDGTLAGDLALTAPDLSRALAVVGVTSVSGACQGALRAGGSLDQPQVSLNLSASALSADTYTLGDLTLAADLDPGGRLSINRFHLQNGNSRIQGQARIGLRLSERRIDPDFNTAAQIEMLSVSAADFMASPPVGGTLDGRLTIDGPLTALEGALAIKASSLNSRDITIGDMDTRLRWDNGTLQLDHLDLANRTSTLSAKGHLQVLAPGSMEPVQNPAFTFNASTDHLDPKDFVDTVKGDFTLQAALAGNIDTPTGTIVIKGEQIDLGGQTLSSLSLDSRLDPHKLWIDQLVATVVPEEKIAVSGWVGLDRTLAIQVQSDGLSLANLDPLKDRVPASGKLQFTATAQGSMQNPDIDGNLALLDVTVNDEAMNDMHLAFGLHDRRVTAEGDLNFGLNAACDLGQGDFHIDLAFDDTETASYFKAAGIPDLHGKLSGRVSAAGNLQDAVNTKAMMQIDALHLLSRDISLVKADQLRMTLAQRKLAIPEFDLVLLTTGNLRLKGEARLDGRLDMTVNGRLPLAAAGAFSPELDDAAGILALDGRLSGTTDSPLIDARIDLEQIAMVVPGIVQKLHDLNGQILMTSDTIRVQNVRGFLDTGSFALDGTVKHDQFTPTEVNLAIDTQALQLDVPDTLSVLLNTDIDITGRDGTAEAKGEIVILEGLYYKDVKISLLKLATERQRSVEPASEPLTIPYFDTVNLDIAIRHRQALGVENNLAELEISPDLNIGGTLSRPIVSGRAQVRDGTITFQKKTFAVTKGIIDFINPYKTEAEIDIASQAQIRTWTITLSIKGTPDNLDIELSSVPSETDSDILSLILFGKTGRELTSGEGTAKRSTTQIMAELIADTFGEDIKKNTGVDILQVEENGSSDDKEGTGGIKVTVGKHLSDRMTVKYAVESKDGEIIQRAITEYKLLENILVSGFQDTKGIYGSELVFRIEFR